MCHCLCRGIFSRGHVPAAANCRCYSRFPPPPALGINPLTTAFCVFGKLINTVCVHDCDVLVYVFKLFVEYENVYIHTLFEIGVLILWTHMTRVQENVLVAVKRLTSELN